MSNQLNQVKEIGLRLKRIRNNQGMTMQQLAEKVGTSAPNISKFEKEGVRDIEWITRLSDALGQDLLVNEIDAEGTVGEVGQEILIILIESYGNIAFDLLEKRMFGMGKERLQNEIIKLSRIGMCEREQFTDFYNKPQDVVFITAKGLITCKNQVKSPIVEERIKSDLKETVTYEKLLSENKYLGYPKVECYQDFIDERRAEKLIRNLPITDNFYRVNFIVYLQKNFLTGIDSDDFSYHKVLMGNGCYQDLLYRKMFGLTNEALRENIAIKPVGFFDMINTEKKAEYDKDEKLRYSKIREAFVKEFKVQDLLTEADTCIVPMEGEDELTEVEKRIFIVKEQIFEEQKDELRKDPLFDMSYTFRKLVNEQRSKGVESLFPGDWYSTEEMVSFIDEIFPEASSDREKQIDRDLEEIMRLLPQTKEYFYGFGEFKECGLPDELLEAIRKKIRF